MCMTWDENGVPCGCREYQQRREACQRGEYHLTLEEFDRKCREASPPREYFKVAEDTFRKFMAKPPEEVRNGIL